jgi:nucleotidyltransferase/DNA polymerase involved in DNA repair
MFACIYVPNFPVAAALRAEPELRARALAIFEGKAPLEKIIAVNEKASRMSIAPDMTKAQAELCSELALRPRSALQESAAHAALLDSAQSFSPCVEDTAWDTVLLDLAGMESLFGSLPEISRALADRAASLGLAANIAVARNPDAALIAARGFCGVTVIPPGKEAEQLGTLPVDVLFSEEIGSKSRWPILRDFHRVGHYENDHQNDQDESNFLATLERWGIRDLRALAALPEVALSERLGQAGLYLQALACGAASRTLVPLAEPLVFEEAIELEHPIVLLEPLAFLLNRLLEQICARLGSRALATQELRLTLELSNLTGVDDEFENLGIPSECAENENPDGAPPLSRFVRQEPALSLSKGADFDLLSSGKDPRGIRQSEAHPHRQTKFVRKLSLPLPLLDAKLFLKLLQLDLQAHPPGAPIVKIHLAAEPARSRSAQGGLFLPPSPEPEKLELTLARIAGMVGENKVGAIELLDKHHPEAFRMRRFVSAGVARVLPSASSGQALPAQPSGDDEREQQSPVTALHRFRPPLRANVTLENGQPARVLCRKKEVTGNALWKAGPWRSSGDWWDREPWSRDEWDIALQNDAAYNGASIALFRLVHDLLGGGWFVEGTYD